MCLLLVITIMFRQTVAFVFLIGQIVMYSVVLCLQALAFAQYLAISLNWSISNDYLSFGIAAVLVG